MKLDQVMNATSSRVSDGSDFLWDCYGSCSRSMDFLDKNSEECVSVVYDTETQFVYEITANIPGQDCAIRWIHDDFRKIHNEECEQNGIDADMAWDTVMYTNVDTEELILSYVKDICELYYDDIPFNEQSPMKDNMDNDSQIDSMKQFTVKLDVQYVFDVQASSYNDAIAKAGEFQKTMPTGWGKHENVCWVDHYIVKENVYQRININAYD